MSAVLRWLVVVVVVVAVLIAVVEPTARATAATSPIEHVVVVLQENRSFDNYFGTFPGADGLPAGTCLPTTIPGRCLRPYHDTADVGRGGPHGAAAMRADIDRGHMDGFV